MRLILCIIIIFLYKLSFSQEFTISNLFNPGIRIGLVHYPETALDDNTQFTSSKLRTNLIIPLNGKINFSLKELDIQAKQHFFNFNANIENNSLSFLKNNNTIYNYAIGLTGVRAGLQSGLWAYQVKLGDAKEFGNIHKHHPYFSAGALKIKIKGINKIYALGAGVLIDENNIIPVPLVGIYRKIGKNLRFDALLPLQMELKYKISPKASISLQEKLAGYSGNIKTITDNINTTASYNNTSLNSLIIFYYKASGSLKIFTEAGMALFYKLNIKTQNPEIPIAEFKNRSLPFFSVTARYNFGKFLFGSQMFGSDE